MLRKSSWDQLTASNRLPVSVCRLLARLLTYSAVLFSSFSAKTFRESTQLRGLTCPPSAGGAEVLRVSFRGQFDVRNRLPLSTFRLLSSSLTYFALSVLPSFLSAYPETCYRSGIPQPPKLKQAGFVGPRLKISLGHSWRADHHRAVSWWAADGLGPVGSCRNHRITGVKRPREGELPLLGTTVRCRC